MKKSFFVTGTDTDVGKTLVSSALLQAHTDLGLQTLGLKPVAAGCTQIDGELQNDDALALMSASSIELSYPQVNPVALEPPIAPHIAAQQAGKQITVDRLSAYCRGSLMRRFDLVLVEGAGGWRVPLNDRETLAGLARELSFPVILVVGMKLGCLSHALLTVEAIYRDGLTLAGWVANQIDPNMAEYEANLAYLKAKLPGAFLGEIPFLSEPSPREAMRFLDIEPLRQG